MRNLVKYVGIGLLVMGLAACDNSDSKAPTVGAAAESNISAKGQTAWSSVILGKVDDKLLTLQVTLPADNQQQAQTEAESIINTLTIQ